MAVSGALTPVLLVQSDTQIPPTWELQRLRHALHAPEPMAARLIDHRGHGGHPVLIGTDLAQHIRAAGESGRLDRILGSLPGGTMVGVNVRRFRSYPRLNYPQEWNMAIRQLRAWARHP